MTFAGLAAALLISQAGALTLSDSPTLDALRAEQAKDPAAAGTRESARALASSGFSGDQSAPDAVPSPGGKDDGDKPAPPKNYTMPGVTPIKGLTIHTPKLDPNGDGHNTTDGPKSPIKDWMIYGSLGVGAAATVGGFFFPPLLFLGGLGLGIGLVLWFIKRKLS